MSEFWQDKQVIVTGGCGMVGSRLCEFLRDAGADVASFDNESRGRYHVEGCYYYNGDATSKFDWLHLLHNVEPFAIFNLAAAVGGVYYNLKAHTSQFYENVKLQTVPVMMAEKHHVPVFVQTSSVCVYADDLNDPAREENGHVGEPEAANAGYAWAKRMGERVCDWTFTETKWCVVRPTNMFGLRDYFDERAHVIPALIKKMQQDRAIVYGGTQTREFLYADDGARGMMAVAEHGKCGEVYNLGTNGETQITIGGLAEMIYYWTGSGAKLVMDSDAETGDKGRSTDSSKANALGWSYEVGLEDGLRRVLEWYRQC